MRVVQPAKAQKKSNAAHFSKSLGTDPVLDDFLSFVHNPC